MIFADLESVRIVKNYDLGLENAALGWPRAAFSRPRSQFSLYGPPSRQITYTYFVLFLTFRSFEPSCLCRHS